MEKKKTMLILGGAAVLVLGYLGIKYYSKQKATVALVTGTAITDATIASTSGIIAPPINPPAGAPTPAQAVVASTPVNVPGTSADPVIAANAPVGYGYDYSANVYRFIGSGTPPNGAWTLPVS